MTVKQLFDLVDRLDFASSHMLAWIRRRNHPQLAGAGCDQWCYEYARQAGRYANQLIDLAELGEHADRKLAAAGGDR